MMSALEQLALSWRRCALCLVGLRMSSSLDPRRSGLTQVASSTDTLCEMFCCVIKRIFSMPTLRLTCQKNSRKVTRQTCLGQSFVLKPRESAKLVLRLNRGDPIRYACRARSALLWVASRACSATTEFAVHRE